MPDQTNLSTVGPHLPCHRIKEQDKTDDYRWGQLGRQAWVFLGDNRWRWWRWSVNLPASARAAAKPPPPPNPLYLPSLPPAHTHTPHPGGADCLPHLICHPSSEHLITRSRSSVIDLSGHTLGRLAWQLAFWVVETGAGAAGFAPFCCKEARR